MIWIEGGAIVGYCSIAIDRIDNAPPSMTMIAMTIAKIGRSMKNLAMADGPPYQVRATAAAGGTGGVAAGIAVMGADGVAAASVCTSTA